MIDSVVGFRRKASAPSLPARSSPHDRQTAVLFLSFVLQVEIPVPVMKVRDLFQRRDLGVFNESFRAKVNPSGVVLVKLERQRLSGWDFKERDLDVI